MTQLGTPDGYKVAAFSLVEDKYAYQPHSLNKAAVNTAMVSVECLSELFYTPPAECLENPLPVPA